MQEPRNAEALPPGRDTKLELLSVIGYLMLGGSAVTIVLRHEIVGAGVAAQVIQGVGLALMVWARLTFRSRSLHLAANPTEGGLVTTGPYRLMRHPVYSAALLVILAAAVSHPAVASLALGALALLGVGIRVVTEERLVAARYPAYADYARRTKRLVPFIF